MASVLLHTREPLRVIEACAQRADSLVITERLADGLDDGPVMRLVPAPDSGVWDTWWDFAPELLARFLGVIRFGDVRVSRHEQRFVRHPTEHLLPMFTVVARRA
jgi:hypothetical protein